MAGIQKMTTFGKYCSDGKQHLQEHIVMVFAFYRISIFLVNYKKKSVFKYSELIDYNKILSIILTHFT